MTHYRPYTLTREDDIELQIQYHISKFHPATGRSWSCAGEPASGGDIEELEITHDGKPFEVTPAERQEIEEWIYDRHDSSEDA